MKRVITRGIRYEDFDSQRELFSLMAAGEIEIIAEIQYEQEDPEIFGHRCEVDSAMKMPFDIIVCPEGAVEEAERELSRYGKNADSGMICSAAELSKTWNDNILKRQVGIIRELVEADDSRIADREWLAEKIYSYGIYPFFKMVKVPQEGVSYSTNGILQVPDEFVDFCLYISGLHCENAIEIGVARGGSSYVMAALLYRNNPNLFYEMVDIADSLVNFEEIKKIVPAIQKRIPATSADFIKKEYDFCFIDADHSYGAVMEDYRNVGQYARKITAYHDVFGHEYDELDGGTVRGWKEIKELAQDKEIKEFTKYPDKWMGIGVVVH